MFHRPVGMTPPGAPMFREAEAGALGRNEDRGGTSTAQLLQRADADAAARDRGPGAPLPPTLVFMAGVAAGWWLHLLWPMSVGAAAMAILVPLGASAIVLGTILFGWGLATFARANTGILLQRPARMIVEAGPYRWSRNPQYIAFTLIYAGTSFVLGTLWPLLLLPAVITIATLAVIAREERYLRRYFASDYDEYCQRVPRWI